MNNLTVFLVISSFSCTVIVASISLRLMLTSKTFGLGTAVKFGVLADPGARTPPTCFRSQVLQRVSCYRVNAHHCRHSVVLKVHGDN